MSHLHRSICAVVLVSVLASSLHAQTAKLDSVLHAQEFLQDWRVSKQFTLEVANAMPAESYNFKPNPEVGKAALNLMAAQ